MISNDPENGAGRRPKVLVCITEDWFAVSHFLPLLETLVGMGVDTAVITRVRHKRAEIEATGARIVAFDWQRGAIRPAVDGRTALALGRVFRSERPDVIHAIALKPIALATVVGLVSPACALAVHLTGVGYAGTARSGSTSKIYALVLRLIANRLRGRRTHLFVENPDDVAALRRLAPIAEERITVLGGAGVDPAHYPHSMLPTNDPLRVGFIGRLVWSKGVDVLMTAHSILRDRGVPIGVDIGGTPDLENPRSVTPETLDAWAKQPQVRLAGRVDDIPGFWAATSIAVVPSRGGEGLPRALLEAACCGRPLIVTDVPGCRYFVRDGVEGFVVPAENPIALADALARLAADPALRSRMGEAARARVLAGFTEMHVRDGIRAAYRRLLG